MGTIERVEVSGHALERAMERVGHLWVQETQRRVDPMRWLKDRCGAALLAFGGMAASSRRDCRMKLVHRGLQFGFVVQEEGLVVLATVVAPGTSNRKRRAPRNDYVGGRKGVRELDAAEQMEEFARG